MTDQQENSQSALTLWCCDCCTQWWISQPAGSHVWRLFRLFKFPNASLEIGKCPVWKVSGPDPSVCPECGMKMSKLPLPKQEMPTPYVALLN